jgi:2-phosphosulfolactate phosphatase
MIINTFPLLEGAKKARGAAVVIDVFRAFTVECYLYKNNVKTVIPVADIDIAYGLKKRDPGIILIGERGGITLPGCDYGNSPAEVEAVDFTGKTVAHTTSAGTQGLDNASQADIILTGSLVNSKAIAKYLLKNGFQEISLIPMGLAAVHDAEEDTLCASYIERLLRGEDPDISADIEALKSTTGRRFFDPMNEFLPQRDFALCTRLNIFDFVLKAERAEDGLLRTRRINV